MSPERILQITSAQARLPRAAQAIRALTRLSGRESAADFADRLRNDIHVLKRLQAESNPAAEECRRIKIAVLSVEEPRANQEGSIIETLCEILSGCGDVERHSILAGAAKPDLRPILAREPDCLLLGGRHAAAVFSSSDFGHVPYLLTHETAMAAHEVLTSPAARRMSMSELDRLRQLLWDAAEIFAADRESQMTLAPFSRSVRIIDQYASRMPPAEVIERQYIPVFSELQRNLR